MASSPEAHLRALTLQLSDDYDGGGVVYIALRWTTMGQDKRKQSLYFPEDMLSELQDEAKRQDRSLSWIVQMAWKRARNELAKIPSTNELAADDADEGAGD